MNQNTKQLSEMTLEELWQLFPIILSAYNPDWKLYYNEEKELLTRYFGNIMVRISHIGSTAVEGLTAKPTVDILLEVTPDSAPETVREIAARCGYTVMSVKLTPEYRLDLCKGYTPHGFEGKVFHLHIRHPGDWDEIVFRDYLRQDRPDLPEHPCHEGIYISCPYRFELFIIPGKKDSVDPQFKVDHIGPDPAADRVQIRLKIEFLPAVTFEKKRRRDISWSLGMQTVVIQLGGTFFLEESPPRPAAEPFVGRSSRHDWTVARSMGPQHHELRIARQPESG